MKASAAFALSVVDLGRGVGVVRLSGLCRRSAYTTRSANIRMAQAITQVPAAARLGKEPFRLSPSDFAFQWEDCPRCFYLKSHGTLYKPRTPFPSIFNKIDMQMKMFFRGRRTETLFPGAGEGNDIPRGEFLCEEEDAVVESTPVVGAAPGASSVYIYGKLDCLVRLDDGTYAVIDFKTSAVNKYIDKYSRQLHAYAHALENPSERSELAQLTISRLGLVVYEPQAFSAASEPDSAMLQGALTYVDIPRNDEKFTEFLGEVGTLLAGEKAPKRPARKSKWGGCAFCNYLEDSAKIQ